MTVRTTQETQERVGMFEVVLPENRFPNRYLCAFIFTLQ